jgi:hypothetical protein
MFTLDYLDDAQLSFRFKCTRYLGLTEAQMLENEQMWAEEFTRLRVPTHYLDMELAERLSSEG